MKRIFAAIKITPDENFLRIYYALMKGLHFAKINWVKPESMHLTLKFFGETPGEKIELINSVISSVSVNYSPFNISIKNIGIFGSSYDPKVIWFGTEKTEYLIKLVEDLLEKLNENGFLRDRQNFVSHLTIGRIKDVKNKKLFQSNIDQFKSSFIQEIQVDRIVLYESLLSPAGPIYSKINEYILGGQTDIG